MERVMITGMMNLLGSSTTRQKRRAEEADDQHEDISHEEGGKEPVHYVGVLREQKGTGLESLDDESAEENGGDGIPRNAESEQGDHGAAGNAVVSRFRGGNAFEAARPELTSIFR